MTMSALTDKCIFFPKWLIQQTFMTDYKLFSRHIFNLKKCKQQTFCYTEHRADSITI